MTEQNAACAKNARDERREETEMLARFRRDLHRIPELDFDLPKTIAYVARELETARKRTVAQHGEGACRVFSPCESAVCALFDRGTANATAFRADMDALPVTERTGASYASTHEGRMHACGHDGHMSMVLGLAHWLAEHFGELPRSVLLVFQPAEETTGGARTICESGVFERCSADRIFGFHLWPDVPAGRIASRPGALLAASNETTVTFSGKSAHIAKAGEGADALEACAQFCLDAYRFMAYRAAEEPCLLKFGRMEAGTVRNAIAASARIEGSLRTFSVKMGKRCRKELSHIAYLCATGVGCTAEVHFSEGYPPVVNDAALFALAERHLPQLDTLERPLLIAEDFSFYQQHLPGAFFLLGTGTGIPLHADTFDFDESVLAAGLDAYKRLAMMP